MSLAKHILWLILFMPVMAFAHGGLPDGVMLGIFVIYPAIISAVHCFIILAIRWKKLFRYSWLLKISIAIAVLTLVLFSLSVFTYVITVIDTIIGNNDYYLENSWVLLILLLVMLANVWMINWSFKIPKKQYRQFYVKRNDLSSADSVIEVLNLKDKK